MAEVVGVGKTKSLNSTVPNHGLNTLCGWAKIKLVEFSEDTAISFGRFHSATAKGLTFWLMAHATCATCTIIQKRVQSLRDHLATLRRNCLNREGRPFSRQHKERGPMLWLRASGVVSKTKSLATIAHDLKPP